MVTRLLLTLLSSLLLIETSWAAEFNAQVDRTQLQLNEPLLFTLSLINSDNRLRAEGVDPNVDLTLLSNNFNVGRPSASTNYNIYLGQGRSTSEIKVELFPKHTGTLTIPPFMIDGLSTEAIEIDVLEIDTTIADEIFVRSDANVISPWVGQQVVAYLDLYHRVELESASQGSNFETAPVQIEMLSNWKMPQATRQETVNGFDYEVERIAWSVFPNQAGVFSVQLPDIWVTTKAGRQLRLPHQTLDFEVKALPADVPADIIIGRPTLTASSLPDTLKQYELNEWTLTLKAPVGVTALPRLLPGITLPEGLKLYPDPARYHTEQTSAGIMDAADYSLSIMPLSAGEFELPAIRIPYFDPVTGQAALVELPGQTINVAPGTMPQPESVVTSTDTVATSKIKPTSNTQPNWIWQLATVIMTLLWLTTLLKLWRKGNDKTPAPTTTSITRPQDKRHPLQQQLLNAMGSNTLEQGLQRWMAYHPEDRTIAEAVHALQSFCYGRSDESIENIQTKVDQAVLRIKQTKISAASNEADPWQAKSFTQPKKN